MYNIFARLVNNIKRLLIVLISLVLLFAIASPLIINFYVEKQYYNITNKIVAIYPGMAISHKVTRDYLSSRIITKFYINNKLLVLQHDIKPLLFMFNAQYIIANIQTKILSGLPGCLRQEQPIFASTTLDKNRHINIKINPLIFEYIFDFDTVSSMQTLININMKAKDKDFDLRINIPKLDYAEDSLKVEINDIQFNIKKTDNDIKLSTNIDRIYMVKDLKPVVRVVGFYIKQKILNIHQDKSILDNIISFAKLNIYEQYFGPLSTRVQITNINMPIILDPVNLLINSKQHTPYNIMETINKLLTYRPTLMVDLLVKTDIGKVKLLSDFSLPHDREVDVFNKNDFLDAIQANISANIPKKIFFELSRLALKEKLKKETTIKIYNSKQRGNMANSVATKDPKEFNKQVDNMLVERVGYLLKQNIIKEHENNFILDLAIAEGTFYSRLNPFKLFSFM